MVYLIRSTDASQADAEQAKVAYLAKSGRERRNQVFNPIKPTLAILNVPINPP
jgi:hypothetical protein